MSEFEVNTMNENDTIYREDWASESGTLTFDSKRAYQKLVCDPYIDEDANKDLWQAVINDRKNIEDALANLFLELRVSENTGIAMALNSSRKPETVPNTLKKASLTTYETLFVCVLRKRLIGSFETDSLLVDYEQLYDEMRDYRFRCKVMDEIQWRKNLERAWNRLITKGFILRTEQAELFKLSPVLKDVFTIEETTNILQTYEDQNSDGAEDPAISDQDVFEEDYQEDWEEGAEGWEDE